MLQDIALNLRRIRKRCLSCAVAYLETPDKLELNELVT